MKLAGVEIGGTKLQVVLGDESGVIADRVTHTIDAAQGAGVIRDLIGSAVKKFGKLDAIGVGFGGPVNRLTGEIWTSYHVKGWTGFDIPGWLGNVTGTPIIVENDANTAALGEAIAGAGSEDRNVFYVTLGSGVGGGLVTEGRIYHGRFPGETEFGHVRLDIGGRTVQDSCSGWAVNEKIREAVIAQPKSALAELATKNRGAEAKSLLAAMECGDTDAIGIFQGTVNDLAFGLSHVVHLFHPDTIIIGGGLSFIGETLRREVEEKLRLFIMGAFQPGPLIRLSKLKADAVPVGALILAGRLLKNTN
jgi:glucokinase